MLHSILDIVDLLVESYSLKKNTALRNIQNIATNFIYEKVLEKVKTIYDLQKKQVDKLVASSLCRYDIRFRQPNN